MEEIKNTVTQKLFLGDFNLLDLQIMAVKTMNNLYTTEKDKVFIRWLSKKHLLDKPMK